MSNNFLEKNFIYLMFYVPEFPRIGILKCRVYVGYVKWYKVDTDHLRLLESLHFFTI